MRELHATYGVYPGAERHVPMTYHPIVQHALRTHPKRSIRRRALPLKQYRAWLDGRTDASVREIWTEHLRGRSALGAQARGPRRVNGPAGRPRASSARSSVRSGDSPGDDDPPSESEPAAPAPLGVSA